ncbi:hypothetical protein [Faunimonas pinastri]|uniref:hypothetical protein n=1 Tax=Faunimonas pinastri TaxID=1855383 RepID=UPI000B86D5DF|nr:hypothetical protein [Faunimonas pinastri]
MRLRKNNRIRLSFQVTWTVFFARTKNPANMKPPRAARRRTGRQHAVLADKFDLSGLREKQLAFLSDNIVGGKMWPIW